MRTVLWFLVLASAIVLAHHFTGDAGAGHGGRCRGDRWAPRPAPRIAARPRIPVRRTGAAVAATDPRRRGAGARVRGRRGSGRVRAPRGSRLAWSRRKRLRWARVGPLPRGIDRDPGGAHGRGGVRVALLVPAFGPPAARRRGGGGVRGRGADRRGGAGARPGGGV